MKTQLLGMGLLLSVASSCTIIRPGEVGVKQHLGKLSDKIHTNGSV